MLQHIVPGLSVEMEDGKGLSALFSSISVQIGVIRFTPTDENIN